MRKTNTVIVGQGIAGSLIAFMLYRKKIPFIVMDPCLENTASSVAAGMFTPVTGKRKTIQPLVQQQVPFAVETYQSLEKLLGVTFLHLCNVHQVFSAESERAALVKKATHHDFHAYLTIDAAPLPGIPEEHGAVDITNSGWVDCSLFIRVFRIWLQQQESFVAGEFIHSSLVFREDHLEYGDMVFKNIIFCEGFREGPNPFFSMEQLIPCKGDVLSVEIGHLETDKIVKRDKCYLIPMGRGAFKAGATYGWHDASTDVTENARKEIEEQLHQLVGNSFRIVDHKTGTRPTTPKRNVIARQHAEYKNIFMFNGLGTKGVLLGPWWANYLVSTYF